MSFRQTFEEVLIEAKKAFHDIEKTEYEKSVLEKRNKTPFFKSVGFVSGTRKVLVYQ